MPPSNTRDVNSGYIDSNLRILFSILKFTLFRERVIPMKIRFLRTRNRRTINIHELFCSAIILPVDINTRHILS